MLLDRVLDFLGNRVISFRRQVLQANVDKALIQKDTMLRPKIGGQPLQRLQNAQLGLPHWFRGGMQPLQIVIRRASAGRSALEAIGNDVPLLLPCPTQLSL